MLIKNLIIFRGGITDPFLISDVYNKAVPGSSFNDANSNSSDNTYLHNGWFHDKSKITMLYCQLQKVACENPGQIIDFEFFDDKIDIINELYAFFSENSHLIPQSVNLKLYKYTGEYPELINSLEGSGLSVNPHYANTVRQFANDVLTDLSLNNNLYTTDGEPANLVSIQAQKYNCGVMFKANDYSESLVKYHDNPKPMSSHFILNIMASKELQIAAGIFAIAGLAAITVGTLGIAGIIAAIASSAAIATTAIGSGVFVTGAGVSAASFFVSRARHNNDYQDIPESTGQLAIN